MVKQRRPPQYDHRRRVNITACLHVVGGVKGCSPSWSQSQFSRNAGVHYEHVRQRLIPNQKVSSSSSFRKRNAMTNPSNALVLAGNKREQGDAPPLTPLNYVALPSRGRAIIVVRLPCALTNLSDSFEIVLNKSLVLEPNVRQRCICMAQHQRVQLLTSWRQE